MEMATLDLFRSVTPVENLMINHFAKVVCKLNCRYMRCLRFLCCVSMLSLFFLLTACTSSGGAPVDNAWNDVATTQTHHKVQPGETLYSIAWRYNVSDEDLIRWNHLQKPYYVTIGQNLTLTSDNTDNTTAVPPAAVISQPKPMPALSSSTQSTSKTKTTMAKKDTVPVKSAMDNSSSVPAQGQGRWPWPVKGKVTEGYNQNANKGIDIAVPTGTKVKAVQSGTVVYAGSNLHGYGKLLIVKQKDDLMTAYAHNSQLLAKEGDKVSVGQTIALSGDTEAEKPMLHFEVRKAGKSVDPMKYLN